MKKTMIALAAFTMVTSFSTARAADAIEGIWDADDGGSKIKIFKCGESFCNKIVWLDMPRKDAKNEDKSLRDRDLLGLTISDNLKPAGDNRWSGSVYSPKKGKTYNGFASVSGDKLSMKGCLTSADILCQTVKFVRDN